MRYILNNMYANKHKGGTFGGMNGKLLIGSTTDAGHAEDGPTTGCIQLR